VPSGQTHTPGTAPWTIGGGQVSGPLTQLNVFFTVSVMPIPVIVIGEGGA
jgi:hypothetical protein